jgi:hypothetical protein
MAAKTKFYIITDDWQEFRQEFLEFSGLTLEAFLT